MKKGLKITLISSAALVGVVAITLGSLILPHKGLATILADNMRPSGMKYSKEAYTGTTYLDIQYSEISESDTLDLYIPNDIANPKLMVLIHGGGFVYNDSRSRQARFMYEYFRGDYAVASLNYRLAQEAIFPAAVEDVKSALRYLTFNAKTYGYDPTDITIWGESAGGYLATMATFSPDEEYGRVPFVGEEEMNAFVHYDIGTLLDYYGILDFSAVPEQYDELDIPNWLTSLMGTNTKKESEHSITKQFFGEKIGEMSVDKLSEINPMSRIDQNVKYDLNVYITHGTSDITVPNLQSKMLFEKLKDNIDGDIVYALEDHYRHADDRFYSEENLKDLGAFLK